MYVCLLQDTVQQRSYKRATWTDEPRVWPAAATATATWSKPANEQRATLASTTTGPNEHT